MTGKNDAEVRVEKRNENHPGDQLIINCLPLDQSERQEFLQAAPGVRQEFIVDTDMRQSMHWLIDVPESLRSEGFRDIDEPMHALPHVRVDNELLTNAWSRLEEFLSFTLVQGQAVDDELVPRMVLVPLFNPHFGIVFAGHGPPPFRCCRPPWSPLVHHASALASSGMTQDHSRIKSIN